MRRREFITLVGGAAAAWPLAARAQSAVPVVGYVGGYVDSPATVFSLEAFRKGLSETGYVEGKNVSIEYRWVAGQNDRLGALLRDLIERRVAVIAAITSTAAAIAAKAATQTIPIVFRIGSDPVANGLVAALNQPGANVTGITTLGNELGQKRLQILRELSPAGVVVVLLVNPLNANAMAEIREIQAAANVLDVHLLILNASSPSEINAAFSSIARQDVSGLLTTADPFFFAQRDQIVTLAARRAIPAIYSDRIFYEAGGLMSYGASVADGYRLAGIYVGRILKGEKPSDLPVQQSTKVELLINLKTAKSLGFTIPLTLLSRADEVIE